MPRALSRRTRSSRRCWSYRASCCPSSSRRCPRSPTSSAASKPSPCPSSSTRSATCSRRRRTTSRRTPPPKSSIPLVARACRSSSRSSSPTPATWSTARCAPHSRPYLSSSMSGSARRWRICCSPRRAGGGDTVSGLLYCPSRICRWPWLYGRTSARLRSAVFCHLRRSVVWVTGV